jgi:hypothetical protein
MSDRLTPSRQQKTPDWHHSQSGVPRYYVTAAAILLNVA